MISIFCADTVCDRVIGIKRFGSQYAAVSPIDDGRAASDIWRGAMIDVRQEQSDSNESPTQGMHLVDVGQEHEEG